MRRIQWPIAGAILFAALLLLLPWFAGVLHLPAWSLEGGGSDLAAIMAAIFTAGGLIIALVSVFTLFNVNKVVDDGVAGALKDVSSKFDERIETFLRAYSLLRYAQDLWVREGANALQRVDERIEDAEKMVPNLIEIKEWAGLLYFQLARLSYLNEKIGGLRHVPGPSPQERPMLATKALQRLEDCLERSAFTAAASIGMFIAELHALLGDRATAVAHLISNVEFDRDSAEIDGVTALTLIASCRNASDVSAVLGAYGCSEWTADEVKAHLLEEPRSGVQLFVALARQPAALQYPPATVGLVTLRSPSSWQNAFFEWNSEREERGIRLRGAYPELPNPDASGAQNNPPFTDIDVVLAELIRRFVIVAPFDPNAQLWLSS